MLAPMGPTRLVHRVRRLGELAGLGVLAAVGTLALAVGHAVAASPPAARTPAPATNAHQLDLTLPPLRMVLTPQQLQSLTAQSDDSDDIMQDVTVHNAPYQIPVPVGTFRALGWAIIHPLDAWRIFTPILSP